MSYLIVQGDARRIPLADQSVQCVVTSPPFFGLRDYNVVGQIGLEQSVQAYLAELLTVFRECWRILRDDGVMFVEMGDSYSGSWGNYSGQNRGKGTQRPIINGSAVPNPAYDGREKAIPATARASGFKPKDKMLIPHRFAIAMQEDGWTVRQDCVWHHVACMPESVTDRPTNAHSYVFQFTKGEKYYYDSLAVAETSITKDPRRPYTSNGAKLLDGRETWHSGQRRDGEDFTTRNLRSVWPLSSGGFADAHFATFPPEIPRRCILAGTSEKGCCAKCRKGWVREVEKTFVSVHDASDPTKRRKAGDKGLDTSNGWGETPRGTNNTKTLAWHPSCQCNAGVRPCVVFDPFSGSASTVLVADRLGRHGIGLDLSMNYCKMGRDRIGKEAPLFANLALTQPEDRQDSLF